MNPLIQFKTAPRLLITLTLLCFGPLPKAEAVVPPPDGGYPGGNTAEGQAARVKPYNRRIQYRSWFSFPQEQHYRQLQHSHWRWDAPCQYCRLKYGDWHRGYSILK